jgi:type IV pilus assembly protein PilC
MSTYPYSLTAQKSAKKSALSIPLRKRISKKMIMSFTRDLSIMLSARMLLIESLHILAQQNRNEAFGEMLRNIINQLKSGISLADCLRRYPKYFNNFYTSLVEVGQLTGELNQMLTRVSQYLEKIHELKRKLIQALTYPSLIIGVAILSLSFIMFYVIPTFATIFKDFNSELPWLTLVILNISVSVKDNVLYILLIFLTGILFINRIKGKPKFQLILNSIILNIPIIGGLTRKNYISQFCRTLGTLLSSGVSLLQSLDIAAKASNNYYIRKDIQNMKFFASKGEKLTRSLQQSKIFPLMVTQMIAVGEETAELPYMLIKISDHYDKEIDAAIETLSSVLEPIIIIFLGIVIGTVLISIYLPLFNMTNIMP